MKQQVIILIAAAALFLLPSFSFAQRGFEDVVYLKNGSIIRGTIIEQVPNESIKIQTKDRSVFVYRIDEVLKITKEETGNAPKLAKPRREGVTNANIKKTGYTNITEITMAKRIGPVSNTAGSENYINYDMDARRDEIRNGLSVGVQTINGYLFSPYFSMGIGIGLNAQPGLALMPLFADFRINFLNRKTTPYISLQAGNSFTFNELIGIGVIKNDRGGLMGSAAGGIKFFVLPKMALNASVGFRYQELLLRTEYFDLYSGSMVDNYSIKEFQRLFNIRFGFTF
jgi:hypothetical protein